MGKKVTHTNCHQGVSVVLCKFCSGQFQLDQSMQDNSVSFAMEVITESDLSRGTNRVVCAHACSVPQRPHPVCVVTVAAARRLG